MAVASVKLHVKSNRPVSNELLLIDSEQLLKSLPQNPAKEQLARVAEEVQNSTIEHGWPGLARRFSDELISSLKTERVESNYTHPAEYIIEHALKTYKNLAQNWIKNVYDRSLTSQPWLAADILICIGHLDRDMIDPWGFHRVIDGFKCSNIEVREAAVAALELWGGEEAINILTNFANNEPVTWLANYIKQVIIDLSE